MSNVPPQLVGMAGPQQLQGGIQPGFGGSPVDQSSQIAGQKFPNSQVSEGPSMDVLAQIFGSQFPDTQNPFQQSSFQNPFQPQGANPFLTGEFAPTSFDPFAGLTGAQQPSAGPSNNLVGNSGFGQFGGNFGGMGGRGRFRGEVDGPRGLLGRFR